MVDVPTAARGAWSELPLPPLITRADLPRMDLPAPRLLISCIPRACVHPAGIWESSDNLRRSTESRDRSSSGLSHTDVGLFKGTQKYARFH